MLVTFKTHKHIYDVTNMIILFNVFFWIKLLLKLSNILRNYIPKTCFLSAICVSWIYVWVKTISHMHTYCFVSYVVSCLCYSRMVLVFVVFNCITY